jgi:hypothetical protein
VCSPWKMCNVQYEEDVLDLIHSAWESVVPLPCTTSQRFAARDKHFSFQFLQWVLHKTVNIPQLLCHILWTDEAGFTRNVRTPCNSYTWTMENPHVTHHSLFQQRFSVNAWARIIDDYKFRLYLIENFLSGVHYSDFLEETLPLL